MSDFSGAPEHLSYSQLNGFLHCGEQYRLEKVHHVPYRPSWATVGGKAVHAATEAWDLMQFGQGVTLDPFEDYLEQAVIEEAERTGYARADFRASGRATKEWPNKEGEDWWRANGPVMVDRWVAWRQNNRWEILEYEGTPAIEIEVNVLYAGTMVKAYIDRIMVLPTGELAVVDLKTGSRMPEGSMQLGLYAESFLRVSQWTRPQYGFFWNGRTGSTSEVFDLGVWSPEFYDYAFGGVAERKKKKDLYLPKITNMCVSCGVRDYCRYVGGERAGEVPAAWEDKEA